MFDQTQMKKLIQAAEQAWYACPHAQNIVHQTREQKKCFTLLIECLMAIKFNRTRRNTTKHNQTRSNTITQDQTRSNSIKQGVQTVKCLVTKQCLMMFGRQTFIVCPGPDVFLFSFQSRKESRFPLTSN